LSRAGRFKDEMTRAAGAHDAPRREFDQVLVLGRYRLRAEIAAFTWWRTLLEHRREHSAVVAAAAVHGR
jgi:hypothetical protein